MYQNGHVENQICFFPADNQPCLLRMAERVHRCQNDNRAAGPTDAPLRHHRNGQRELANQPSRLKPVADPKLDPNLIQTGQPLKSSRARPSFRFERLACPVPRNHNATPQLSFRPAGGTIGCRLTSRLQSLERDAVELERKAVETPR